MITDEKLSAALELISKGITRPTKIAKAMGIAYRTYCSWMVRSNAGDERFLVEYNEEVMQWAKAITLATKLALFELRGMVLQEGIFGYDEVQTKDGQIVWALDAEACAEPDLDIREMLYGRRDGLLVIDGKLQPVTIRRKAPFAQQIRLLEAAFADLRPSQTINQNVNLAGQVGVGFAKPVDYSQGPPAVPPPPARPELPAPTDAEFSEIDDDDFGLEPVPIAPINFTLAPVVNVEPEPVAPPPAAFDEPPRRPARTPLEQSLYDELDKARARRAQQT